MEVYTEKFIPFIFRSRFPVGGEIFSRLRACRTYSHTSPLRGVTDTWLKDLNGMNLGMSAATEVKAYFVNTMII